MTIFIKNGTVVDPVNNIFEPINIMVENGKIALLTKQSLIADNVIDASGNYVSPGFIDIHVHEDPINRFEIEHGVFDAMLKMGVTTVVGGNCGDSFCDPINYLDAIDKFGAPVNVLMLAGHGYMREYAGAKNKYEKITPEQEKNMVKGLEKALSLGCPGISFGLRYFPGTDEHELYKAVECVGKYNKLITAHVRDDAANIFKSIDEVAAAAVKYNVPVQISHIGSMGGFGQMDEVLEKIQAYRDNGLDIMCDCYPYYAFSTQIGSATYDEGWLERYNCDYSAVLLTEGKYKGMRCTKEIFDEVRKDFPQCITVCHVMRKDDVIKALCHKNVMLASDALLNAGQGHPRAAGTFPKFYNDFVNGNRLSALQGINKMSAMPAKRLGLLNKGRLSVGADGDITIFNPNEIIDKATFEEPTLPPLGINTVIIGGKIAYENNKVINPRLGKAIRI